MQSLRPFFGLVVLACAAQAADQASAEFFETKIRPVLAKNCYACHTDSRMGGLRLDSREAMLQGGKSGPAMVAGDAGKSRLVLAIRQTDSKLKMPPTAKLAADEIEAVSAWIQSGAPWPATREPAKEASSGWRIRPEHRQFWSFQPLKKPAIPEVKDRAWAKTPIDRFVLARLEAAKLKPAAPADKATLLRRVTFDLTGLPPAPAELDAFLADRSPDAFARVVDRLLASPAYGERWGRHWLDLARYADGQLGADKDTPYPQAYRYRDWVIQAFNDDLPYDQFIRLQLAADFLPRSDRGDSLAALGFHGLMPSGEDRVDVTSKVFLGLTVGCAQCHDHKFDPIPTKDFYSLQGVFRSSEIHELPLAAEADVKKWADAKKRIDDFQLDLKEFREKQTTLVGEILATQTAAYLEVAYPLFPAKDRDFAAAANKASLDAEILERWVHYLEGEIEHPHLDEFRKLTAEAKAGRPAAPDVVAAAAARVQAFVDKMYADKRGMDDRNYVALGGTQGSRIESKRQYTNLESLDILRYYFWRDLCSEPYRKDFFDFKGGVYFFPAKQVGRFLSPLVAGHIAGMEAQLEKMKKDLPPKYEFLHGVRDTAKPANMKVELRGNPETLGEEAPRRFLQILCNGEPQPYSKGSGRMELAESIASPANPLTARVMVNRIWQHLFKKGLVRTPSNFGQLGERPTHPELLDYLAARFVESGWRIKALQREMLLSNAYQMSSAASPAGDAQDPGNHLLWRAHLTPRLDAEALRDALLSVSGRLDRKAGGPPEALGPKNLRRTVYAYIGRTKQDEMLSLFDFPNPNNMADERTATLGPMQRLYFMNNAFLAECAAGLAKRLEKEAGASDEARLALAYRLLFSRGPSASESRASLEFLRDSGNAWTELAHVLLAAAEFSAVN